MNPAQQEQLLSIGAYLQSIREEHGKTVDDVASQIFIRPALVKAIEKGDWESLPEPIFVQGFIRRYADFLGLDGMAISKQFEPTLVSNVPNFALSHPDTRPSSATLLGAQDSPGIQVLTKVDSSTRGNGHGKTQGGTGSWWLLGWLALIPLIGLLVWAATRDTHRPPAIADAPTTPAPKAPESVSELPVPAPIAPPEEPVQSTEPETPAAPITFKVNLDGDSWMRVTVDGEEVYEGILAAGTEQSWTAQNELRVTAGNAGAVKYSFNGGAVTPLGKPGAVSNLTLTPDTAAPAQ
jgi:hypothetical protein